jgi:DNA-binding transcriptional MocR family regulator
MASVDAPTHGRSVAETCRRTVVVRPPAGHLRRVLGATSWVLLEELLARSIGNAELSVTTASIRSLAESLGVAKDTVGRAVTVLRSVGLLTVVQHRTVAGVFGATTYRITVPADMFSFEIVPTAVAPAGLAIARPVKRTHRAASDSQLSFTDI